MRGGRGGSGGGSHFSAPEHDPPERPAGTTIATIDTKCLLIEEHAPVIKDVEYVASYNWIAGEKPTILVPGCPPTHHPLPGPQTLRPDSADLARIIYRDINSASFPRFPVEPTVRSIHHLAPSFDFPSIDVLGCGSTLGNLLRFSGSIKKPFRFDVDVVGDTVVFVRRENTPDERINGVKGYGHTFPEAYTTWEAEVRGSVSHQRIIKYEFAGLQFIVRFEVDSYMKPGTTNDTAPPSTTSTTPPTSISTAESTEPPSLSPLLKPTPAPSQDAPLRVLSGGHAIPPSSTIEIKTRADYNTFSMPDILPRLWLTQTLHLLLAYHHRGTFDEPAVKDVSGEVREWQASASATLARFGEVVRRVVEVAWEEKRVRKEKPEDGSDGEEKGQQGGMLAVYWDGQGLLEIIRPDATEEQIGRALPGELMGLWGEDDAEEEQLEA